jgi:hypothetical protein
MAGGSCVWPGTITEHITFGNCQLLVFFFFDRLFRDDAAVSVTYFKQCSHSLIHQKYSYE